MIDLKTITDKDIFNVRTEEEYKKLCELFHEAGYKWSSGKSFIDGHSYDGRTNINPVEGMCNYSKHSSRFNTYNLEDILQSTPSSSSSFQTLFPFNL